MVVSPSIAIGGRKPLRRSALVSTQMLEAAMATAAKIGDSRLHLVDHCHGDQRPDCPILGNLAAESDKREERHEGAER
jgi:MerR family transcriptional regulator, copper efflux regulator